MKAFWIFWKELKTYFVSPISYIITAVFLVISGYLFGMNLIMTQRVDFFPQLASAMVFILMFVVPALTMRLLAEERQQRTIALLLTSPVSHLEIVLGKYFACLGYLAAVLLVTGFYPLVLAKYGSPDWGVILSSYLGAFLILSCFAAIGVFASSLSDSQMLSAVVAFGISLFFWIIHFWKEYLADGWLEGLGDFVYAMSLHVPLLEFMQGAIHLKYVIFYLSFAGFFLFLAHRKLSSSAWR